MSWQEIRSLGKGGKEYRVADAYLKRHPGMKSVFNKYSERKELGKRLAEAGGVKYGSISHDRFGLTESEAVGVAKKMAESGSLSDVEARRFAKDLLKGSASTASFKRQQMREMYDIRHGKADLRTSETSVSAQSASVSEVRPHGFMSSRKPALRDDRGAAPHSFGHSDASHVSRTGTMPHGPGGKPLGPSIGGSRPVGSVPTSQSPRPSFSPPRLHG